MAGRPPKIDSSYKNQQLELVFNESQTLSFRKVQSVFAALQQNGVFAANATIGRRRVENQMRLVITIPLPTNVSDRDRRLRVFRSWMEDNQQLVKIMAICVQAQRQTRRPGDTSAVVERVSVMLAA